MCSREAIKKMLNQKERRDGRGGRIVVRFLRLRVIV